MALKGHPLRLAVQDCSALNPSVVREVSAAAVPIVWHPTGFDCCLRLSPALAVLTFTSSVCARFAGG
jgi:hypothetical protein